MSLRIPFNKVPWNKNIRNVFVYFFSSGFSRSIPFLLLPLLTRVLSPTDFGILGITAVLVSMITPLITFYAPGYIYAHYFKLTQEELNHTLSVIVSLAVIMAYIITAIAVVLYFLGVLETALPIWTILSIILMAFSMSMLNIAQTLNQIETRIKRYVTYEISNAILISTMVVILVLVLGMKWEGRFLAGLAGNLVVGTAALIYLIKSRLISPTWNLASLKAFLGFSVPILPHVFGLWALNGIARLFLARFVSLDEAGYFQVAFQLTMILALFYEAMFKVWNPFFYRHVTLGDSHYHVKRKLVRYSYYYIVGVLLFAAGFLLISQILIHIFVYEKYAHSAMYLPWLVFGMAVYNVTRSFTGYLFHTGRTKLLGIATAISALTNVTLAFVLNRYHGPVGVAQATFLAFTVHSFLIIALSLKSHPMPWLTSFRRV
ncbi:lipopolysaccharide biosynthesis protein [Candidatus Neomarinimicrobiota bacterium]